MKGLPKISNHVFHCCFFLSLRGSPPSSLYLTLTCNCINTDSDQVTVKPGLICSSHLGKATN